MNYLNKIDMRIYPIVPSFSCLEKLCHWGIKCIQLRIKDKNNKTIEREIINSIEFCKKNNVMLFINDYWELAIKHKAYGVHLGFEDSQIANIKEIKENNIVFGLSTHDLNELNYALSLKPNYIALGPIFETQTKKMNFQPQGYRQIKIWRQKIQIDIPLVAIGGIKIKYANDIYLSGADSISVISDILNSENPEMKTKEWIEVANYASK